MDEGMKRLSDFESCINDAFELLHRAVDIVDENDHDRVLVIKKLIESKILSHERYVHSSWLKKQTNKIAERL